MNDAFKDIEKLETDLWEAADNLRANSKLTSSDYFMPVLGVIFLRHAANRFEVATRQIAADRAAGRMPKRGVLAADYVRRRALWLPENARDDWIMRQAATSGSDLPTLVTDAMTAIEEEFAPLKGVLPKDYGIFEDVARPHPRLQRDDHGHDSCAPWRERAKDSSSACAAARVAGSGKRSLCSAGPPDRGLEASEQATPRCPRPAAAVPDERGDRRLS